MPTRRRTGTPDVDDTDGGSVSDETPLSGPERHTVHSLRTPRVVDGERQPFDEDTAEHVRRRDEQIKQAERDGKLIELMITSSSDERREQTKAITASQDKLGERIDAGFAQLADRTESGFETLRSTMIKGLVIAGAIYLVALLLLGSVAGAVVWFKGSATGGVEFTTNPPTHVPISVPVKVRVSDTDPEPTED